MVSFPQMFPPKLYIYTSALPHTYYMPRPSHSSRFDRPNNNWSIYILKNSWIHFRIHQPPSSVGVNGSVTVTSLSMPSGRGREQLLVLSLPSRVLPLVLGTWKALSTVISASMPNIQSQIARHVVLIPLLHEGSCVPSHFIYAVTSFIKIDYLT
jgi:hypothetical protein